MTEPASNSDAVELATELTIAWLSNPNTRAQSEEIPQFLKNMYDAVAQLSKSADTASDTSPVDPEHKPAVSVRKSLASPTHIISLIDGKPYKTLRRHLASQGLSPDAYRERYGLKPDYPMVAPAYAEQRRELAKKIGLGRKSRPDAEKPQAPPAKNTRRRTLKIAG
jgi:predicted transcriptional regulator